MWLDLAIAMSCGGTGLACGWIMHAISGFGNHKFVQEASAAADALVATENDGHREQISDVAERLKAFAHAMAADVDAHQTKVQAVNHTLTETTTASPEAVFHAINQLIAANEAMQGQLQSAQDRIHNQAMQLESAERRAETDALTRVPNRGAFDRHFQARHRLGAGKAGTVALLDVDKFKSFNDVYGHRAGDEVLRIVAHVLHARLNSYGMVARFGGEEFVVILDDCPIEKARELVEAARAAIGNREIQFEDKRLRVTASAGVAELNDGESLEQWLQRADDGLYRSKEAGRDCDHWMNGQEPIRIESICHSNESDPPAAAPVKSLSLESSEPVASGQPPAETTAVPPPVDLGVFGSLANLEALGQSFAEIRGRTQANVSIFVMAIRCNTEGSKASRRSLLQIVRATLRSVDRLGCHDEATLLVCMPSVDSATAHVRATQTCRSASAIGIGKSNSDENPISIGIAQADLVESFAEVVARAVELAMQGRPQGVEPVCMEGEANLV